MSHIKITDADGVVRKVDTAQRVDGPDTVEAAAGVLLDPSGAAVDPATKALQQALNTIAAAVQAAVEAINAKVTAVNTGAVTIAGGSVGVVGAVEIVNDLGADIPVAARARRLDYWPGYNGPAVSAPAQLAADPAGALITRGSVTTDEGSARINFANASLEVAIGSCTFANGSRAVSGSGFLALVIDAGDYVKLQSDAESAWAQVESIDSDTALTLVNAYGGSSATGTAVRAMVQPVTGAGATVSVASGQCTLGAGTTASSVTEIRRLADIMPLNIQAPLSLSQRIANQDLYWGARDPSATIKYFAWFRFNGTNNTQVICETGYNPTGAPVAAETESTTVTLPNGLTSAVLARYRIEIDIRRVRYYINEVLVASHERVGLHPNDPVLVVSRVVNGATPPASNTNFITDALSISNFNKLRVEIGSDQDQVVTATAPLLPINYNQAGVIAINTDLLVIDCQQLRGVFVQCVSMGTTGVVTPAFSNDGVTYTAATLFTPALATAATIAAAGLWFVRVMGRFLRLRLTTATTGGTTTFVVMGTQQPPQMFLATQPVSGTVTANQGTMVALPAGTNLAADVGLQYRASATGAASRAHLVSAATTNATVIKASAGRLLGYDLSNTTASWVYVKLHNQATAPTAGTGVVQTIGIPPNGKAALVVEGGVAFATGIAYTTVTGAADADNTAVGASAIAGDFFFA